MHTYKTLTGHEAIAYAQKVGLAHVQKYADPTECARKVTLDEARAIAAEDPSLIYLSIISVTGR